MKITNYPIRTCVITREKLPKRHMLRLVKTSDNLILIDHTGKKNGHGVYVKPSIEIFEKYDLKKILKNIFKLEIKDSLLEELKQYCK